MPKRFKILFITAWYPHASNPMHGIFIREHAKAVSLYDDVRVIHLAGASPRGRLWTLSEETDQKLSNGIPTYHLSTRKFPLPGLSFLVFIWGIWRAFLQMQKYGFVPDILHANIFSAGVPAVILGKLYHLPVLISEHYSGFPRKMLSPMDIFKARFAFERAARVILVSQALKKGIEQYHIRANFRLIPNAVDLSRFLYDGSKIAHEPPKFLFVGSLIPIKGLDFLLKALECIKDRRWTLDIVGDGPERAGYEKLSRDLMIDRHLSFHGYQSHDNVAEFMRQADLFISSSLWDNFPSVLVEAQACGLPIVGTDVGGIPEIVYPGSGWLARPGDITSLSETLALALDQLSTINREEISMHAKKYSRSEVGLQFHRLYEEVSSKRN